jgi:hypothetical protein
MRLTAAQEERYARHLLLDGLGGEGQERLLASCVRVRGAGRAALWAARYLAASGVGALVLDDAAAARECGELSPDVRVSSETGQRPDFEIELAGSAASDGAEAALRALRALVGP